MNNNINPNTPVILNLTADEAGTIVTALLELPAKVAMDIIAKIRAQALPQIEGQKEGQL
jgi:hypothetical protein